MMCPDQKQLARVNNLFRPAMPISIRMLAYITASKLTEVTLTLSLEKEIENECHD